MKRRRGSPSANLERFASRQRNTPLQRQSEITGNICAAAFTHDASRALDPQLHTHFVIANATCDRAGNGMRSTNTKWSEPSGMRARSIRTRWRARFSSSAMASGWRGKMAEITGFEIEGVSDALCERFSKRREEIERQIEKFEEKQGRKPTVKEIALITRETRPAALKEIATARLLPFSAPSCRQRNGHNCRVLRAQAEAQTMPIQVGQEHKALRASISHLFERSSVLREHEILAEALNQSLGSLDLETLKQTPQMENLGTGSLDRSAGKPVAL